MMICRNCGTNNADTVRFCVNCGCDMSAQMPNAAPVYQQPVQPIVPGKGMGIAGMVLGIVSLVLFCIWYISMPCGIVGLILSCLSYSKAKKANMKNGMAVAGIVCSAIALGIAVLFLVLGIIGLASLSMI